MSHAICPSNTHLQPRHPLALVTSSNVNPSPHEPPPLSQPSHSHNALPTLPTSYLSTRHLLCTGLDWLAGCGEPDNPSRLALLTFSPCCACYNIAVPPPPSSSPPTLLLCLPPSHHLLYGRREQTSTLFISLSLGHVSHHHINNNTLPRCHHRLSTSPSHHNSSTPITNTPYPHPTQTLGLGAPPTPDSKQT